MNLILIAIAAIIVNNFVLSYFVGICPFIGVSRRIDGALSMGIAVTFVTTITAMVTWVINTFILVKLNMPYLQYVAYIVVIAALVQLVEMFIKKTSPALYRTLGIYLPLITTNCIILFVALLQATRGYNFIEATVFGFCAGAGFTLAIVIMAGMREQLDFADIPRPFRGAAITLIAAGILALAFMGFSGLIAA